MPSGCAVISFLNGIHMNTTLDSISHISFNCFNDSSIRSFSDHESSMWRAVITQALMDAASHSRKSELRRSRNDALEWLLGTSPDFEIVCDNAGLDPDYVRTRARFALARGFVWRLPAGEGWRTQKRLQQKTEPTKTH
jgi:hypothetical protein